MSEEENNPPSGEMPPRIQLKKISTIRIQPKSADQPGAPVTPLAEASTVIEQRPVEPADRTARIDLTPADLATAKKKTSRIPLEAAMTPEGASPALTPSGKTIRIKRPSRVPTTPAQPAGESVSAAVPQTIQLEKKKTSRIPLEAAMSASGAPEATVAAPRTSSPKTIRIARLGQVAAVKLDSPASAEEAVQAEVPAEAMPDDSAKGQTSQIELPPSAEAAAPTQRKTIKIRRPDGTTGGPAAPRVVTIARQEEAALAAQLAAAEKGEGKPVYVIIFSVLTIITFLVSCVLLWALAAQLAGGSFFGQPVL